MSKLYKGGEMDNTINEIVKHLTNLPDNLRQQVLEFIRSLDGSARGVSGKEMLRFVGTITREDLEIMSQEIEKECGRIDLNEW
jgi:hypothetical protein